MRSDNSTNPASNLEPSQAITRVIMHCLTLLAVLSEPDSYLLNLNLSLSHEDGKKTGAISLFKTKHVFPRSKKILLTQIEIIENFKIFNFKSCEITSVLSG